VLLGDTVVESGEPVTQQLARAFDRYQESMVALEEVEPSKVSRYGIISGKRISDSIYLIEDFVEKPSEKEAPSNLAIAGRYVLTADIFDYIEQTAKGKNDEIQLTDALRLLVESRAVYGFRFDGCRYDIGNRLDFVKTNLLFALEREDMREDIAAFVKDLAKRLG
jgi:UTP--glucose-1-phosphate uridylyltransferase